ncbi:MAG: pyrroline-5-carboxylate reductase [Coriobacteriales bacterium]|nr:pyrroline-5-carboxylate reductase [Coriobacteriales bacterium]
MQNSCPDYQNLKLGFIGFGNMASAIVDGLLKANAIPASNIHVCANSYEKLIPRAQMRGIIAEASPRNVISNADFIFIAVKPYLVAKVLEPVRDALLGKTVVSVAVNMPYETYETILAPGTHHISTLPNTPVRVCEGVWICENAHSLNADELKLVQDLLGKVSRVVMVDTALMGIAGTITGCGPAFIAMCQEALADAAVKHGVPRTLAYELAGQMIAGTGKLAVETNTIPAALKDAVCSPGGTTIKGVAALERSGLRAAFLNAIDAIEG